MPNLPVENKEMDMSDRAPGPWDGDERSMIVSTTPTLQGHQIVSYRGLASGEAILGANIFRDLFANIRDIVGGQSGAYEKVLKDARNVAVQEMKDEAAALGANAVVGVDLDYGAVGQSGGMLMVTASGTAVVLE